MHTYTVIIYKYFIGLATHLNSDRSLHLGGYKINAKSLTKLLPCKYVYKVLLLLAMYFSY